MVKEADYQDDDIVVISRSPLKGKLLLITEDDQEIELHLERDSAEALMSALGCLPDGRRDRFSMASRQSAFLWGGCPTPSLPLSLSGGFPLPAPCIAEP
ncbi:hypothetical protein [Mesorhizobium sp. WSM3224]|uniref:hypothetical protein n=1 Tax=Mesorhizobium sp. WSM3224 TaxID=1040986 RepID=UPI000564B73E|nr:hypothetical protein [Mesorhizobium sp. WSM3224]